jgi:sigma-B regulation protein RsbU (phosphoserine phosphatase)
MRYAPDVRNDPYYIGCEPATLSEVAIPLRVGEKLVGVFTASHHEVDAFPRQQLRILQALCDHVAVAIQNARRFQSERAERAALDREAQEARTIQQALLALRFPVSVFRRGRWEATGTTSFPSPTGAGGSFWPMFLAKEQQRHC